MRTKTITQAAIIAAVYVSLTLINPLSFGMINFRVAELLKPLLFRKADYLYALVVGMIIAALFSPLGIIDLLVMPQVVLVSGILCRRFLSKTAGLIVMPFVTSAGVAFVLSMTMGIPACIALWGIFLSEISLYLIGDLVITIVETRIQHP